MGKPVRPNEAQVIVKSNVVRNLCEQLDTPYHEQVERALDWLIADLTAKLKAKHAADAAQPITP